MQHHPTATTAGVPPLAQRAQVSATVPIPPVRWTPPSPPVQPKMSGAVPTQRPAVTIPPVRFPHASGSVPPQVSDLSTQGQLGNALPPVRMAGTNPPAQPKMWEAATLPRGTVSIAPVRLPGTGGPVQPDMPPPCPGEPIPPVRWTAQETSRPPEKPGAAQLLRPAAPAGSMQMPGASGFVQRYRASRREGNPVTPTGQPHHPPPGSLVTQANRTPRFVPKPSAVVQRMRSDDPSVHYSGYWPPDASPPINPPTPSGNYYREGADYHYTHGDFDAMDEYMDTYEGYSGTTIGQTVGSGESDDYDASYIDIPTTCRPSAPASLWKQVYNGLKKSNTYLAYEYITCAELCNKTVWVDTKTKCEDGTNKKPPMCHKVPYNHIRYAVEWIYQQKGTLAAQQYGAQTYKGPNAMNFDSDTWKNLVWELENLQPGHASCNSQTAQAAKGAPTGTQERKAITYTVKRLKSLKPTWF